MHHLLALAHLLRAGAGRGFVPATTAGIGRAVGRSQQAASKHLSELEAGGLVERAPAGRGSSVRVTRRGREEVSRVAGMLRESLGGGRGGAEITGELVSGMGEGAYYMSLAGYTGQFRERIGYVPFPGTLNVRLDAAGRRAAARLGGAGGVLIDGFSDGRRSYGWVRCHAGTVNGAVGCYLVRLERTHHDGSIAELIARSSIRRACGLRDGSRVSVRLRGP